MNTRTTMPVQRSVASASLAAIATELKDAPRMVRHAQQRDTQRLMEARDEDLGMKPMPDPVETFAPRARLPDYVEHQPDATRAGMLSAHAVVMEFEATAREVEALGNDLRMVQEQAAAAQETMAKALGDLNNTVKAYREEAARLFKHVEDVTSKASEATALAATLREKLAT